MLKLELNHEVWRVSHLEYIPCCFLIFPYQSCCDGRLPSLFVLWLTYSCVRRQHEKLQGRTSRNRTALYILLFVGIFRFHRPHSVSFFTAGRYWDRLWCYLGILHNFSGSTEKPLPFPERQLGGRMHNESVSRHQSGSGKRFTLLLRVAKLISAGGVGEMFSSADSVRAWQRNLPCLALFN